MNRRITLLNYTFIFKSFKSKDGQRLCQSEYFNNTQPNANHITIKKEDIEKDVLPYRPDFNADYSLEELPEEVWDKLHDHNMLPLLKEWLVTCYFQIAMSEVITYAEENN